MEPQHNDASSYSDKLLRENIRLSFENKELQKICDNYRKKKEKIAHLALVLALGMLTFIIIADYTIIDSSGTSKERDILKTRFTVENLKQDVVHTWKAWILTPNDILTVNIVESDLVTKERVSTIKKAILSEETIKVKSSNKDTSPTKYYHGWLGALKDASLKTDIKYYIPQNIEIISDTEERGDIKIKLTNLQDQDGFTGFTNSLVIGNKILQSTITIYDVENLSDIQLETIIKHEFGHALGLAHSNDPNDLMYPAPSTENSSISYCDIIAIQHLYNGGEDDVVDCKT